MSSTSFWSPDGKPMSAAQFIEKLYGELPLLFKDEDELRRLWSSPDTRKALMNELEIKGFGRDQLNEIKKLINAEKSEVFDVLAYIAYALAPRTREERANMCREKAMGRYEASLQEFLDFVLTQYVKEGSKELESPVGLIRSKYSTPLDAEEKLGSMQKIREAFVGFQQYLYKDK